MYTASGNNPVTGTSLFSPDRPGKGSVNCFVFAIRMNFIKMGLKSASAFYLSFHGRRNISSFYS